MFHNKKIKNLEYKVLELEIKIDYYRVQNNNLENRLYENLSQQSLIASTLTKLENRIFNLFPEEISKENKKKIDLLLDTKKRNKKNKIEKAIHVQNLKSKINKIIKNIT